MKVNIFGVARSGTKLVQLYTCLLMLKKNKKCYLNYEPFYWKNRICKYNHNKSKRGIAEHQRLPLYVPSDNINDYSSEYLRSITMYNDYPVITKFNRSNGRIAFINRETNVKKIIFVIRSLNQTLNSIYGKSWDLFGEADSRNNNWNRLQAAIKLYGDEELIEFIDGIQSDLDKNALYWCFMNTVGLETIKGKNILLLHFNKIKEDSNAELAKIAYYLIGDKLDIDIHYVSGSLIHTNNTLIRNVWFRTKQPELIRKPLLYSVPHKKTHKIKPKISTINLEKKLYQEMDEKINKLLVSLEKEKSFY